MRDLCLRILALLGGAAALLTEALSLFHLLRPRVVAAAWAVLAVAVAFWIYRRRAGSPQPPAKPESSGLARWKPALPQAAIVAAILAIALCVGLAAAFSPPNTVDALMYHLPRVVYWAQAHSVAFYPTPYLNQISQPPLAEYLMLHTYLVTGGDRLINLLTFGAFLATVLAVSALAGALGLGRTGQAVAALFCATLPNGILQASGAKNDWLLALFLVLAAYFAVRREEPWLGLSLGLALATKATACLFAPPLVVAGLLWAGWPRKAIAVRVLVWTAAGVLAINAPQYARNIQLSGNPLGFDSAQANGLFRWRNEHLGWRPAVSNALRNASEQLGARSPRWNQAVFGAVLRIHRTLGLDPQDPDTTWRWSHFAPPLNTNHEADANNRWHLLILLIAAAAAGFRSRRWLLYGAALAAAFLLFCFYLKFQPFMARLELPLFVLGAPLAAFLIDRLRPRVLIALACLFLASVGRLPATENWTRPLKGPRSVLRTARDAGYFSDLTQLHNRESYLEAVDLTARSACQLVGIDSSENHLEYPFQALLRERRADIRFVHMGVTNPSARYAPADPPQPCAVLCLDCAGNAGKAELYRHISPTRVIGRFTLYLAPTAPWRRLPASARTAVW